MPVNPEVVRSKLLDIEEAVGRLRSWLPVTIERLEHDGMLRWAVEHGLHIAAEALFDTGNHVLAGEFQESADEYREIPPLLAARGVLTSPTARRLDSLAGFRNVLVHDYATVDVRRVHAGLARLDDLEAFVADVEAWPAPVADRPLGRRRRLLADDDFSLDEARVIPYGDPDAGTTAAPPLRSLERA